MFKQSLDLLSIALTILFELQIKLQLLAMSASDKTPLNQQLIDITLLNSKFQIIIYLISCYKPSSCN